MGSGSAAYCPDHRNGWAWVVVPKAASNSLLRALAQSRFAFAVASRDARHDPLSLLGLDWYAFIRHPLDRLLAFNATPLRVGAGKHEPLEVFIQRVVDGAYDGNAHVVTQDSILIKEPVFLGRFEKLAEDYARLRELIGGPEILPHRNPSAGVPWQDQFYKLPTELQSRLIDRYSVDFDRFGYERPV